MKEFNLRILYPSSNQYGPNQDYTEVVKAAHMFTSENSVHFVDENRELIALYPSAFLIIESVKKL